MNALAWSDILHSPNSDGRAMVEPRLTENPFFRVCSLTIELPNFILCSLNAEKRISSLA